MKSRCSTLSWLAILLTVVALEASAATRLASIYFESQTALQQQLARGAQLFEAPQLAALPMLLTMRLPGAAQIDPGKPVALHILDGAPGQPGLVLEVAPSGTAEAYMRALGGVDGAPPALVNGVYKLAKGMTLKVDGGRMLVALNAKDPETLLKGVDALPAMPALAGAIRIALAPAALRPMIEQAREQIAQRPAADEASRRMMDSVMTFYSDLVGQIDAQNMAIDLQDAGLFIRTRMAAKPGTDIAALVASAKPASAAHLGFVESGTLFGFASGGAQLPDAFRQRIIDVYVKLLAAAPTSAGLSTEDLTAFMTTSIQAFGAPMAFRGQRAADGLTLLVQGVQAVANPTGYLDGQLAMLKSPAFKQLGGLFSGEPVTRTFMGLPVYTWETKSLEAGMDSTLRQAIPGGATNAAAVAMLAKTTGVMRALFGIGYEYAATPRGVVFGMGAPAMIEQAIRRLQEPAKPSAEADRIRHRLAVGAAPHALGRLSLQGLIGLVREAAGGETAAVAAPVAPPIGDDGVIFANWTAQAEMHSVVLIPPGEVKAVVAGLQSLRPAAPQP